MPEGDWLGECRGRRAARAANGLNAPRQTRMRCPRLDIRIHAARQLHQLVKLDQRPHHDFRITRQRHGSQIAFGLMLLLVAAKRHVDDDHGRPQDGDPFERRPYLRERAD